MNNPERGVALFKEGFSCSQAVLAAYGEQFDLKQELALRVAGAFGGGMGRMGETCGAVTGAIMVLGMKFGSTTAGDLKARENAYAVVREFVHRFKGRNVSTLCRELLDCDISTPEGMKRAKEEGLIKQACPKFVKDAAEILDQLLELWRPDQSSDIRQKTEDSRGQTK
jgi:C_GCAxxG_C_C family probable redox protein